MDAEREREVDDLSSITDRSYGRLVDYPDAVCVHSDGIVVAINTAGVAWAGAAADSEIIGRPITDFVHPDSVGAMLERIAVLAQQGDSSEPSEATMVRVDGTLIDVEATSIRVTWDDRPAYLVILRDVAARVAVRDALRYQEAVVNHVTDAVIAISDDGRIASWNPAATAIYRRPIIEVIGAPIGDALGVAFDAREIVAAGGTSAQIHRAADGRELAISVAVTPVDDGFVVICSDKTALARAEQYFRTVVDSIAEGIIVVDRAGRVTTANPAAKAITGVDLPVGDDENATLFSDFEVFDSEGRALTIEQHPICQVMTTGIPLAGEVLGVDLPSGRRVWISASVRLMDPGSPSTSSAVCSFTDISEQQTIRADLEFAATHDSLTALPNRGSVVSHLGEALAALPRARSVAALFIDLDRLKLINDSLGHSAGDRVLQVAARRLKSLVSGSDLVGRVGGDEFVAIVFDRPDRAAIEQLADELHRTLRKPFVVDGELVDIGASIGVALIGERDIRTADDILRDADIAMYAAKTEGRGRTQFYVPGLRERMRIRMRSIG